MKYKKYLLIAAALVMVAASGVAPAMAYFTDSHTASGMVTLSLGDSKVVPDEDFDPSYNKLITISNTGSFEVMVRVKAIYGSNCTVTLDRTSSTGWSYDESDGYFYYASPLAGKNEDADGGVTSQLKLIVAAKEGVTDDFNVIIVEEAAKVYYENGVAKADWNQTISNEETLVDQSADNIDTTESGEPTSGQTQEADKATASGQGDSPQDTGLTEDNGGEE